MGLGPESTLVQFVHLDAACAYEFHKKSTRTWEILGRMSGVSIWGRTDHTTVSLEPRRGTLVEKGAGRYVSERIRDGVWISGCDCIFYQAGAITQLLSEVWYLSLLGHVCLFWDSKK